MDYFRKLHMIFLSLQELGELWRASMFGDVILEMFEKGYSPRDRTKLEIVTDSVSLKRNKQKEDIEIFIAISMCISFFGEDNSKIGFPLIDSFSPKDSKISSLQDLKNVSKENHLTDFAIFYDDKILEFQLKQYKKEITTDKLLTEMIGTIKKYGYTLGTTNIIFNLQGNGPPFNEYELDFGKIHREIHRESRKIKGY